MWTFFLPSHSTCADSVRLGRPLGLALVQWLQPTPRRSGGADCHYPAVNQKAFPGSLVLETHLTIDSYLVCKDCKAPSFRWASEQGQRSRTWGNAAWRMGTSFFGLKHTGIDWLIDLCPQTHQAGPVCVSTCQCERFFQDLCLHLIRCFWGGRTNLINVCFEVESESKVNPGGFFFFFFTFIKCFQNLTWFPRQPGH